MEIYFDEVSARVTRDPAPEVEIVGDSVAAGGILPDLLHVNGDVRNDALPGSGPLFSYLLVRREIAAGHIPKVIIVAHSPHTFAGFRFAVLVGGFARWSELPDLLWSADDKPSFLYGILTRFSYVLTYRDQFREALLNRDFSFFAHPAPPTPSLTERLSEYRRLVQANRFHPRTLPPGLYSIHRIPFTVTSQTDLYFSRLLSLAKTNGIKVYWVTMPVPERVHANRGVAYDLAMRSYLDGFVSRGELDYLQRDFLVYDDALFDDLSHLNMAGAVRFTSYLDDKWPRQSGDVEAKSAPSN